MEQSFDQQAAVFKAFCDPRRLRILSLLRGGEKCTCTLTQEMGMPQSSLSYHMRILCQAGVVTGREDGKWTHYQISKAGREAAVALLAQLLATDEGD